MFMEYNMFNFMFYVTWGLVFVLFVVIIVKNLITWNKNNHSPRLNVNAVISSKRTNVSRHNHGTNHASTRHTTYYVTFEVESGDRLEFNVSGEEYGMLAEGDSGILVFQGTRYISFTRE